MIKRKNYLSWFETWDKLLCGEHIAAIRLSRGGWCYLRRQAQRLGRKLVDSGMGIYQTYHLA